MTDPINLADYRRASAHPRPAARPHTSWIADYLALYARVFGAQAEACREASRQCATAATTLRGDDPGGDAA